MPSISGKYCFLLAASVICGILAAIPLADAVSFTFLPDTYVTIVHGVAPNHRFSVAAHGDGTEDRDTFSLFLMAEPAHKKIGRLEEIEPHHTDPLSCTAKWSPNSRYVAISYRADTHSTQTQMYRIADRRAYPISLPDLADAARTKLRHGGNYHSFLAVKWLNAHRFVLTESCRSHAPLPEEASSLKYYRIQKEKSESSSDHSPTYAVIFSAEAVCELRKDGTCRLISIKPGKFDGWAPGA